jgi:hypothetical protein
MAFHDHQYAVYLVLAAPEAAPLWEADAWNQLAASLQSLTSSARGKTSVRSLQYNALGKDVSFGRLGWDKRSFAKWNHANPHDDPRRFAHVEAWAPSWNQCVKDNSAPDFFLALANERMLGRAGKQLLFNQRIIAALALEAGTSAHAFLRNVMCDLALQTDAPLFVHTSRPWGISNGSGFSQAIQDMIIGHLFKPGDPHARPLDLATFSEPWAYVAGRSET